MNKTILNLGSGKTYIKNAQNIDFFQTEYCDKKVDLGKFPWHWEDNSISEIYMIHVIEHFDRDQLLNVFKELHRILKPNGLLHIQCPHFSSMLALSCIDHKSCFNVDTFSILEGNNYFCSQPLFKKELAKIHILTLLHHKNKYIDFDLKRTVSNGGTCPKFRWIFWPIIKSIEYLANLSPLLFERLWCHWIGGADEILYRGRKV